MRCSCGNETAHIVARRETADGHAVCLWTDGAWTWGALGRVVLGSPLRGSRADLDAGWLAAGEIALWDAAEVPALIRTARRVAKRGGSPGDLRAAMAPRVLRAVWEPIETDRDGKSVVAVWRLPRIIASGLAVWRDRGRYRVMREINRTGTYEAAGSWKSSMVDVRAELSALGVPGVA
jgi:hypothetical protein